MYCLHFIFQEISFYFEYFYPEIHQSRIFIQEVLEGLFVVSLLSMYSSLLLMEGIQTISPAIYLGQNNELLSEHTSIFNHLGEN